MKLLRRLCLAVGLLIGFSAGAQAQIITPNGPTSGSEVFTSSGSGTIPAGATQFRILGIGGGSSGAGGATVASSGSGGGGGGGGLKIDPGWMAVSGLPQLSFTVAIGAGVTTASSGASGNVCGDNTVSFGSYTFTAWSNRHDCNSGVFRSTSTGGFGGGGNFRVSVSAGAGVQTLIDYNAVVSSGAGCSALGVAGLNGNARNGVGGGGSGGGLNTGAFQNGGSGSISISSFGQATTATGGTSDGANGTMSSAPVAWPFQFDGSGGGGGAGNDAGVGGNGAAGTQPGGGGGGGGSGTTGGGTGGAGGAGAIFIEWN